MTVTLGEVRYLGGLDQIGDRVVSPTVVIERIRLFKGIPYGNDVLYEDTTATAMKPAKTKNRTKVT